MFIYVGIPTLFLILALTLCVIYTKATSKKKIAISEVLEVVPPVRPYTPDYSDG